MRSERGRANVEEKSTTQSKGRPAEALQSTARVTMAGRGRRRSWEQQSERHVSCAARR
ncbi:hypothetical protein BU14_2594s0001 [Porphyra umbilicalis]|uniref:Uncharacterized protein n=1 Tax=Porphyra umbilicalis TaxID=2786 RepID=A0A1X6NJ26_PORUM|nr:hypothetical protein BU14_2594s0001 [Porphyra umbilicalis]|eukprot:OSX68550.1 hypothetical protein BU14_2594s0001 [Porphyra umbilicalis]